MGLVGIYFKSRDINFLRQSELSAADHERFAKEALI